MLSLSQLLQLGYSSVSIISNGSHVRRPWFEQYGQYLDILGISIDSVDHRTNFLLGRAPAGAKPPPPPSSTAAPPASKSHDQTHHVRRAAALSQEFGVMFKLNTVVTALNAEEAGSMSALVNEVAPMRWKIFQVSTRCSCSAV